MKAIPVSKLKESPCYDFCRVAMPIFGSILIFFGICNAVGVFDYTVGYFFTWIVLDGKTASLHEMNECYTRLLCIVLTTSIGFLDLCTTIIILAILVAILSLSVGCIQWIIKETCTSKSISVSEV